LIYRCRTNPFKYQVVKNEKSIIYLSVHSINVVCTGFDKEKMRLQMH